MVTDEQVEAATAAFWDAVPVVASVDMTVTHDAMRAALVAAAAVTEHTEWRIATAWQDSTATYRDYQDREGALHEVGVRRQVEAVKDVWAECRPVGRGPWVRVDDTKEKR